MESGKPIEEKELDAIEKDDKVQRALVENSKKQNLNSSIIKKDEAPVLGLTGIIVLVGGICYFLLGWKGLPIASIYLPLIKKIILAIVFVSLVLLATRLLKKIANRKIEDKTTVFNFNRIADLVAGVLILAIFLSLLFANWYAAMVSFGIVSLILGFALQNPITSFFGWLYILIRKPFEVGDRIRIGDVYGDVINVSYIDTTLWEFKGDYLSSDHPSGRTIRFANSKVFSEYVYNYSWPLFPFLWNEMSFFISYESDFKFASETLIRVVETEIGESMVRRVARYKKLLSATPVDEFDVNEFPSVSFKANSNTWIEITVRYLVEPKKSGPTKRILFEAVMAELQKHPDKVGLPKTNMR